MWVNRFNKKGNPWYVRHSLSLILAGMMIAQMVLYHYTVYPVWKADQTGGPTTSYALYYWSEWLVSVLADTYGALLLVILTKYFYESKSAASKEPEEDQDEITTKRNRPEDDETARRLRGQ